ncbi:MAG: glycosyltransferase family 2 protein [Planctomycetia bacterium]|nr:glycosyltransferase family 2 protein [Planctomycetia bacterium]
MLSIIIPVLNEEASLRELHAEIDAACAARGIEFEIIFVDDGSSDGSWNAIHDLANRDNRVRGIRFRRNFGKAAALSAGMQIARGKVLCMLDADLQDDPREIPKFLDKLNEGCDVVNGWKRRRNDPWHKVFPSRVFNRMVSWLTGLSLHDHNCGLKCFRREVAEEIRLYGELHRFIPVLAHARGFKVVELEVNHRPRKFGHTKYGVRRFLRGFLDLLTVKFLIGFGQRPQHVLGAMGLVFFALGGCGLAYLAVLWFFESIGLRPLLAYSIAALLLGGQLLSLGFLAELIVAKTGHDPDHYSIAERTDLVQSD